RCVPFFLLIIILANGIVAQQKPPCPPDANPLIMTGTAPVFIFYMSGDQADKDSKRDEPIVWLRLHNNTKWAIHLVATGLAFDGYSEKLEKVQLCNGQIDGLIDYNRVWLFYTLRKDGVE